MAISVIGAVLITSIMSFTNYCEDRKTSAILSSLGARDGEIRDIYLIESILCVSIATIVSLIISIPISKLLNLIIHKNIAVANLIRIPFLSFMNVPLLYPLLLIALTMIVIYLATVIPITFSKKNSIKGELQNND